MGRVLVRFRDNRGAEWEAWEVGTPADASDEHEITGQYPKYPRSSWLCFYSSKERRRLAEYQRQPFRLVWSDAERKYVRVLGKPG